MANPYIGHHLNITEGFLSVIDYAKLSNMNFFQIFLSSPQQYKYTKRSNQELLDFNKKLTKNNMKFVIHSNFMLNFCNDPNSFIHKKAIELLTYDLQCSVLLGSIGVIVHMGKKLDMTFETAITNYVNGIKQVLKNTPKNSILIFETGAGVGSEICTSIFELGKLYKRFTKDEQKRIKFCLDTCHIFSAGYDLGCDFYIDLFEELIDIHLGWPNVYCIHLNDSKKCVNSKKDLHADIGQGLICLDGLKKFVKLCVSKNIPIVLETPCDILGKIEQGELVRSWLI